MVVPRDLAGYPCALEHMPIVLGIGSCLLVCPFVRACTGSLTNAGLRRPDRRHLHYATSSSRHSRALASPTVPQPYGCVSVRNAVYLGRKQQ
ncbi:hypothetical protein T265_09127 [Opisthorchis viverrini]|uniref:Uncharacterized protein n=1 Tax=Opisthorchis viverrini TaxID=6198 RepID=A0A074Z6N6_OPIVI|nr:hypothetical protein T265_09127 [Opisthorchis viverrini]KER22851.1 hypothetical protein T265_09127 [Opisthorchis viverrini]